MTIKKIILILSLFICLFNHGYAQFSNTKNTDTEGIQIIDKDNLYSLVTLLDKDGNYSNGFLIGLKSDTLVLHQKDENLDFAIDDLISISIETNRKGGMKGVAIGGILGTYLFYLAFWQAENEPFAYYENEYPIGRALVSLVGTFLGSGVGYLIDKSSVNSTEIFDFRGNDKNRMEEFQRLKKFLVGDESASKIHLSIQLSQIFTRLSESEINVKDYSYRNRNVSSFNLLRKVQLTFSILNELEIGGAASWFGEPSVPQYYYSSGSNDYISSVQRYEGWGFYALAVYKPFNSLLSETFDFKLGAGIGVGNVDYSFNASRNTGFTQGDTTIASINESLLSAIFYTQFDLFLYNSFSLGIVADYIYLPEEIPGIPELDISSRKLGNFSFGFTIGLHF